MTSKEMKVISICDRLNKKEEVRQHAAFILTIMGKLKRLTLRKMEITLNSYVQEKKRLSEKLEHHFSLFKDKSR